MSGSARLGQLRRERTFQIYWLATAISSAGSSITVVVAPLLVYQLTGSALITGLLSGSEAVPYLVFGLFAGAIADRCNRARLMVATSLFQGIVLAVIPLSAFAGHLEAWLIVVAALTSSSLFVWYDAANSGALPSLVGRRRLVEANVAISTVTTLLSILGPALAGVLATTIGPAPAIGVDAISFVVLAVLITRIQWPPPAADAPDSSGIRGDVSAGLLHLWRDPIVRSLTLLGFGNSIASGVILGLLVVYAHGALGLARGDPAASLLFTVVGLGALAAIVAFPWLARHVAPPRISVLGLVGAASAAFGVAESTAIAPAVVCLVVWSACQTAVVTNGIILRQRLTPDHLQSRVNIVARMIAFGGYPFGAAIGGAVAASYSVQAAYLAGAAAVTVSAVLAIRSPLWRASVPAESFA